MSDDLRADLEASVLKALEETGPDFNRAPIVAEFARRGVSQRTAYRWLADFVDSGRAGQLLARRLEERAAARAARTPDPAADAAREAVDLLPKPITLPQVVATSPAEIEAQLATVITTVRDVLEYARTPEGKVRNAKLLLSAAGSLRQSLDTALRISDALQSISKADRFFEAVFSEIKQESPELAERIVHRLRQVSSAWHLAA